MIVERATVEASHCRAVSAALRRRGDCIDDLGTLSVWPETGALGSIGDGTSRRAQAVAAALRELNGSVVHATRVLEEGVRLRNSQREIVADIKSSLLRTERQVRSLANDTVVLAEYVSRVVTAR